MTRDCPALTAVAARHGRSCIGCSRRANCSMRSACPLGRSPPGWRTSSTTPRRRPRARRLGDLGGADRLDAREPGVCAWGPPERVQLRPGASDAATAVAWTCSLALRPRGRVTERLGHVAFRMPLAGPLADAGITTHLDQLAAPTEPPMPIVLRILASRWREAGPGTPAGAHLHPRRGGQGFTYMDRAPRRGRVHEGLDDDAHDARRQAEEKGVALRRAPVRPPTCRASARLAAS